MLFPRPALEPVRTLGQAWHLLCQINNNERHNCCNAVYTFGRSLTVSGIRPGTQFASPLRTDLLSSLNGQGQGALLAMVASRQPGLLRPGQISNTVHNTASKNKGILGYNERFDTLLQSSRHN
jgi:hypothetical protein